MASCELQDASAVERRLARRHDDDGLGAPFDCRLEGAVDVGRTAHLQRLDLDAERPRGLLSFPQLVICVIRIQENADPNDRGGRLFQELDPLSGEIRGEEGDPCHVSAGPREAGDEPSLDRIGAVHHHDGDRLRRPLGERRDVAAESKDDVGLLVHQFDGEIAKPPRISPSLAKLDDEIPAFDVAQLLQPLAEGGKVRVAAAQEQNTQPGDLTSWLRLGGRRRNKEADSESKNEPDPPHAHLCGDGGSLADHRDG